MEQLMQANAMAEQPEMEATGVAQLPVPEREYAGGGIIAFDEGGDVGDLENEFIAPDKKVLSDEPEKKPKKKNKTQESEKASWVEKFSFRWNTKKFTTNPSPSTCPPNRAGSP
jgi:hypothetical protein